jgi:aryl-alcohol dehydrogenase-like predicted oxidoreductase
MQCHRFDPDVPLEETVAAMDELIRQGKVRFWGVGRFDAEQTERAVLVARALGAAAPVANQYFYSFLKREIEAAVLPRCEALGLGILAYSPLAQGVLTGKYGGGRIPPTSRAADERLRQGMWQLQPQEIARVEGLRSIAAAAGLSMPQLALAWCLRAPAVASVIIGASSAEQVRENAAASGSQLSPDLLQRMETV